REDEIARRRWNASRRDRLGAVVMRDLVRDLKRRRQDRESETADRAEEQVKVEWREAQLLASATPFHDLHERAAAQLIECQSSRQRFLFRDRAVVQCADEVIEETLSGCGVVEHIADERRLSRFANEVAEAIGRGGESF